jgi:hypothetical protein
MTSLEGRTALPSVFRYHVEVGRWRDGAAGGRVLEAERRLENFTTLTEK